MADTDIAICSRALIKLGEFPIDTLTDPQTTPGQICAIQYPPLRDALMSKYEWRFLMRKVELSRDSERPIGEWSYSFVLPSDILAGPHAVFTSAQAMVPTSQFEIFGRRVYSNDERLWIDYAARLPEDQWPSWFSELVVAALCADIGFTITEQQSVADRWWSVAYGTPSEGGSGGIMGQAMSIDSQSSGNIGFRDDTFINARFGGYVPWGGGF